MEPGTEANAEADALRARVAELEAELGKLRLHRRAMESLPQKLFLKDRESRFVLTNAGFAAYFGQTTESMVGKTDFDFCAADLAEKYRADDQRVMRSRQAVTLVEPSDVAGVRRFVEVTKAPVQDDNGEVVGVVGLFSDITGRVRAENDLRQSRRLLQAILDNSPAMITIKDAAGKYVMANRMFSSNFGIEGRDAVGKSDHDLFPAADADAYRRHDERVLQTGEFLEVEEEASFRQGRRTLIVLKFPVETARGKVLSVGTVSTDITERKRAERALQESEARKGAILDAALDGVLVLDPDGKVTETNPAAVRLFRGQRADLLGRDAFELLFGETAHADPAAGRHPSMLGKHVETIARRPDGTGFPAEIGIAVIAGERSQFTITVRDISARKEAERQLLDQRQRLASQAEELERRNGELERANAEIKDTESQLIHSEKMAAIGQLVAGLAHEINTPVAYVLTNLSNIDRNVDDIAAFARGAAEQQPLLRKQAPELARRFDELLAGTQLDEALAEIKPLTDAARQGMVRIRDLVANLRAYSRIDVRGELALEDLNEGLTATLRLVEPIKPPEVGFTWDLGELPPVECNLGKINQVLLNLVTNALQAVKNRGHVHAWTRAADGGVEAVVRDDGPGIPPEIATKIFDPFFTTKPVGQGTGLGLSISRRIVEDQHGTLTFRSERGKGTEFRLWLPLRQPAADADAPAA